MSYIVPRDKPSRCYKCPFMDKITYDCKLMYKNNFPDFETQYNNCPLVEIPTPHGRLGDLDKLWNRMYNYIDNEGAKMPYGDNDFMIHRDSACELIEDMPTVIEESET